MDDTSPGGPPAGAGPGSGAVAERMQALLSRAVEDQASEQRQVTTVLAELRQLVGGLSEQLRGTASAARMDEVGAELAAVSTSLRTSNHGLGERLDALSRRVEEQGASSAETASSSVEHLGVRLGGLADDVGAQGAALDRVSTALAALSAFPDALAALQGELSGLHDRLTPLSEVRSGLADLTARTAGTEALRPEIAALTDRVETLATSADVARARDALSATVLDRLERLESAAERPVVGPDDLSAALGGLSGTLDEIARSGAAVERIEALEGRLGSLEDTLAAIGERLNDVGDAAGGVPAVATDVGRLVSRVEELGGLREDVGNLRQAMDAARDADQSSSLAMGLTALRGDVEELGGRVGEIVVPPVDQVASAVSGQLTDRLVEQLAPRIAGIVFSRVAETLVDQVADSVTSAVQNGLTERVRSATAESERRLSAHVDEAILALAEALLRRRRGGRREASTLVAVEEPALGTVEPAAESAGPSSPSDADVVAPSAADEVDVEPDAEVVRGPVDGGPDPVADLGLGDGAPTETLVGLVAAVQAKEREAHEQGAQPDAGAEPGGDVAESALPAGDTPEQELAVEAEEPASPQAAAEPAADEQPAPEDGPASEEVDEAPAAPAGEAQPEQGPDQESSDAPAAAAVQARAEGAEGAERLRGGLLGLDPAEDEFDAGAPSPALFADHDGGSPTREPARTAPPAVPRARVQEQSTPASTGEPSTQPGPFDDEDESDSRRRPWWRPGG